MLEEGARAARAGGCPDRQWRGCRQVVDTHAIAAAELTQAATAICGCPGDAVERLSVALRRDVLTLLAQHPLRTMLTTSERYPLWVDRERALYGAWYEFFPRPEGAKPPKSGTFATAVGTATGDRSHGFRCRLHPTDPSDRHDIPQGCRTTLLIRPGLGRPGRALGDRLCRGRPRRHQPRTRHAEGLQGVRGEGEQARH